MELIHLEVEATSKNDEEVADSMLGGGHVKRIFELHGEGKSARAIATELRVSRNTVRRYLGDPQVPKPKARPKRGSKLDPHRPYLKRRLADGVQNAVVLLRELRARGYTGGYSILKDYLQPFRSRHSRWGAAKASTRCGW